LLLLNSESQVGMLDRKGLLESVPRSDRSAETSAAMFMGITSSS